MDITQTVALISVAITAIIGPIIVEWSNKFIKWLFQKKKVDPIKEAIKHNSVIDHQLDLMLNELECDRVWIAQFHNGGHFYPTGKSIQKFSIVHERINGVSSSVMDTFQNIPISLFPRTFSRLNEESEVHLQYEALTSFDLDLFHKLYNTKSMYLFKIEDLEGRFIGVLAIEYVKEKKLLTNEFIFIRQKMGAVGGILTNYLKQQQK